MEPGHGELRSIDVGGLKMAYRVAGDPAAPPMLLLHALGEGEHFLDAIGVTDTVLIGHSLGGTVGVLLAEAAPDRLTRLVLEDCLPPRPGTLNRPPLEPPDEPLPFDFAVVNAIRFQLTNPDPTWWERTAGISVPTLVVGGGPDSQIPQEVLAELAGRMPDATFVTIAAGHHVHRNRPADFIAAVRDFLSP